MTNQDQDTHTTNERIVARGLTTRPGPGYEKEVLNADGAVLFCGTAREVSAWLDAGMPS